MSRLQKNLQVFTQCFSSFSLFGKNDWVGRKIDAQCTLYHLLLSISGLCNCSKKGLGKLNYPK